MTAKFTRGATLFFWVNLNDGNVCADCMAIALTQPSTGLTWNQWQIRGLPGSGRTVCKNKCRCMLVPNGYLEIVGTGTFIVFFSTEDKKNFPTAVQSLVPLMFITLEENNIFIEESDLIGLSTKQQADFLFDKIIESGIIIPADLGGEMEKAGYTVNVSD